MGNWTLAAQTLSRFGLRSYITQVRAFDEIPAYIERGIPLIISIRAKRGELKSPPYKEAPGHLLVVIGYDEEEKIWVNDPYNIDGQRGPRTWTRKEMEQVFIGRGGMTIVTERRRPDR